MNSLLPFERVKREVLVKRKAESDIKYGKRPEERSVEELINYGVVNINKPEGPTSHQVSDYVQKIVGIKKAGQSGTLDPRVTGVLPITLGKATRVVQTLLKAGKEYVCLMHLHDDVTQSKIYKTTKEFTGKIKQIPPIRSAVKREEREREVYYFDILEIDGKEVLFRIGCEAGTYIRKIAHDFGKSLKCGAHMAQLVRTKAGPFSDKDWVTLHDLKDAYEFWKEEGNEEGIRQVIKPMEMAVMHLPRLWVLDTAVSSLCHGANLGVPGVSKVESEIKEGELVAIFTLKDELICLGNARLDSTRLLEEEKGLAVNTTKVFMDRGVYPK